MAQRPKHKMLISDRAKQFMPFSALRGLDEALAAKEHISVPKAELSEEKERELDEKMKKLCCGHIASVIHFSRDEYIKTTGMVALMDETGRVLQIVNTKSNFDDIYDINSESCD